MISRCPSCAAEVDDDAPRCPSCHWDFNLRRRVIPEGAAAEPPAPVPEPALPEPAPAAKAEEKPPETELQLPAAGVAAAGVPLPSTIGSGLPVLEKAKPKAPVEPEPELKPPPKIELKPPEAESPAPLAIPQLPPVKAQAAAPFPPPAMAIPKAAAAPPAPKEIPRAPEPSKPAERLPPPAEPIRSEPRSSILPLTSLFKRQPAASTPPRPADSKATARKITSDLASRFRKRPTGAGSPASPGTERDDFPLAWIIGAAAVLGIGVTAAVYLTTRSDQAQKPKSGSSPFAPPSEASVERALSRPPAQPPVPPAPAPEPPRQPEALPAPGVSGAGVPLPSRTGSGPAAPVPAPPPPAVVAPARVEPMPAPVERRPAASGWVFEGQVYDLISLQPVYGAVLRFSDAGGRVTGAATTGDWGRYRVNLSGLPSGGFFLRVEQHDYHDKYIDDINPSFHQTPRKQRKEVARFASKNAAWIGDEDRATRRDIFLVPKILPPE